MSNHSDKPIFIPVWEIFSTSGRLPCQQLLADTWLHTETYTHTHIHTHTHHTSWHVRSIHWLSWHTRTNASSPRLNGRFCLNLSCADHFFNLAAAEICKHHSSLGYDINRMGKATVTAFWLYLRKATQNFPRLTFPKDIFDACAHTHIHTHTHTHTHHTHTHTPRTHTHTHTYHTHTHTTLSHTHTTLPLGTGWCLELVYHYPCPGEGMRSDGWEVWVMVGTACQCRLSHCLHAHNTRTVISRHGCQSCFQFILKAVVNYSPWPLKSYCLLSSIPAPCSCSESSGCNTKFVR